MVTLNTDITEIMNTAPTLLSKILTVNTRSVLKRSPVPTRDLKPPMKLTSPLKSRYGSTQRFKNQVEPVQLAENGNLATSKDSFFGGHRMLSHRMLSNDDKLDVILVAALKVAKKKNPADQSNTAPSAFGRS